MEIQDPDREFSDIVREFQKRIFHTCYGIVHNEALAQDLTQEAFLRAYQHMDELRKKESLASWLMTIARNLSLTALRKTADLSFRDELQVEEPYLKSTLEAKEEMGWIDEAIKALPHKQREVFELYDLQDHSHKEIGALLHIPEGTSRSRLHYARKLIRRYLLDSKII